MEPAPALPYVAPELLTALADASGAQLDCNEAWRAVFGDELWGRLPPEDARFAQEHAVEASRGRSVTNEVFLIEPADGDEPLPVLLHFQPIRLPGAEPGRYPVSIHGEVMREPATWAAEQTRRRRMEMLGRMSMGIAHDFNNLLTAVLGHAELLRSDLVKLGAEREAQDHLRSLEQAATDGAALVRKIQQYIRNEKAERAEAVALHAIAEEVLTLTRPYWYNEPRRRGIAIVVESTLRPVPAILGTATELREVLVNLVLNAVQAMPAGGTLTLTTTRRDRAAVVEISDTGVGMTENVRRRAFEPLFTTKGTGGSGMGLTMSQGIVQEHNGRIEIESEPGRGTLFRLVFPFSTGTPAPETAPDAIAAPSTAPGLRLLVVDDEPMVRTVTAKLLRLRGHEVTEVDGGPAALAMLASGVEIDTVVTDLSMPDMSGRELAAALRQRYPGLPVLLLTGDTDAEADGADVAAVVKKPFQLDVLDATVRQVATGNGTEV